MAETKRQRAIAEEIEPGKIYSIEDALSKTQKLATGEKTKVAFDQGVDLVVNLGVDPKKSDQTVRGAVVLPNGTGKSVRVAVFAQGANAEAAEAAGADKIGFESLADEIKAGEIDFDVLIATPDAMRLVGQLGQILGPKGLMPNPKVGTVTPDVAGAVKNAKAGQVRYRADKGGIIHCTVGKCSFTTDQLKENIAHLIEALKKSKPTAAKGIYLKKISLSSTMGPGLIVDASTI